MAIATHIQKVPIAIRGMGRLSDDRWIWEEMDGRVQIGAIEIMDGKIGHAIAIGGRRAIERGPLDRGSDQRFTFN